MLDRTNLHHQLITVFQSKLNVGIPNIDADLMESGILDSLAFVELLVHIEREFDIRISLEGLEFANFRSIAAIADFIIRSKEFTEPRVNTIS
jgi:acyl carrier protein